MAKAAALKHDIPARTFNAAPVNEKRLGGDVNDARARANDLIDSYVVPGEIVRRLPGKAFGSPPNHSLGREIELPRIGWNPVDQHMMKSVIASFGRLKGE